MEAEAGAGASSRAGRREVSQPLELRIKPGCSEKSSSRPSAQDEEEVKRMIPPASRPGSVTRDHSTHPRLLKYSRRTLHPIFQSAPRLKAPGLSSRERGLL